MMTVLKFFQKAFHFNVIDTSIGFMTITKHIQGVPFIFVFALQTYFYLAGVVQLM